MAGVTAYKLAPEYTSSSTSTPDAIGEQVKVNKFWTMFLLVLPVGSTEQQVCDKLRPVHSTIEFAHRNWIMTPTAGATDPQYASQLSLQNAVSAFSQGHINVEGAWDWSVGRSGIKVGVADTGIQGSHADFQFNGASVVTGGYNVYNPTNPATAFQDFHSHGTSVAGIIGAVRNNGVGIAGIAGGNGTTSGVSLYSLKCAGNTSASSNGTIADVTAALIHGAGPTAGLNIINICLSSPPVAANRRAFVEQASLMQALEQVHRKGITTVVSAGNDVIPSNESLLPAAARDNWTLTVGGANAAGNYYSEGGTVASTPHPFVDIVAPASATAQNQPQPAIPFITTLSSTVPAGYTTFGRTSAAAPHAAGVAALMMSSWNSTTQPADNLQPEDVENIIRINARDITIAPAAPGRDSHTGAGMLNATNAVKGVNKQAYKLYHSPPIPVDPANSGWEMTPVGGPSDYYMEGTYLQSGVYNAQAYRVRLRGSFYQSPDWYTIGWWGQNSKSALYGPPMPLMGTPFINYPVAGIVTAEPQVQVVGPSGKTGLILEGYVYRLYSFRDLTTTAPGQPYSVSATAAQLPANRQWEPFDPNSNPNQEERSVRFTVYSACPPCTPIGFRAAPGAGATPAAKAEAYPNPTAGPATVTFAAPATPELAEVQLTTPGGQVLQTTKQAVRWSAAETGAVELSLEGLAPGTYFYRIITATAVRQGRITKAQ